MGASKRSLGPRSTARGVLATCLLAGVVGCDAVLGLGSFQQVACAFDCGADVFVEERPEIPPIDTGIDQTMPVEAAAEDVVEAGVADVVADEGSTADVTSTMEAGAVAVWPHWPMPNPDASIGGDAAARLPNPMFYEGGAEASVVRDGVTGLLWQRQDAPAADIASARAACAALGSGWRVPARIELVSLIDFTRSPTIDTTAFAIEAGSTAWTSSPVAVDASADAQSYWTVSFDTGLVDHGAAAAGAVRCVWGDP